jgi:hypothetical protein
MFSMVAEHSRSNPCSVYVEMTFTGAFSLTSEIDLIHTTGRPAMINGAVGSILEADELWQVTNPLRVWVRNSDEDLGSQQRGLFWIART